MSKRHNRGGFTFIYCTVSLTVLVGFVAFCVDLSRVRTAKSELQAAADAAALNGANGLVDGTFFAKASAVASENKCDGAPVTLVSGNVVAGNWNNSTFTPGGTPRNALRVTAERSRTVGGVVACHFANALGLPSPDLRAVATVALISQADYEWVGVNGINLGGGSTSFKVTAFDATNPAAAESKTALKSNGSVTIGGASTINADVRYGTTSSINGAANVSGTVLQNTITNAYPPGSQVANLNGVTPVYSATYDLNIYTNQVLPGGVYVVKNVNVANCNITFTGPATIVCTGNLNMSSFGLTTHNNLPANFRVITTSPNSSINISNLTKTMYADFYAPNSAFSFSSTNGFGIRGRGVFNNLNVSGSAASLWYDRSLTASSLSRRAVLVR